MREKLIELIRDAKYKVDLICVERDWCDGCPAASGEGDCKEAYIADHLIANCVVIQPDCQACAKATNEVISNLQKRIEKDNNVPSKWIPVTERLPERFVYVLAMTDFGEAVVARLRNGRWYIGWDNDQYDGVTHWMPLPEPPKGE